MAGRRKRKVDKDYLTADVREAFEAALKLWDEWESPDGPAVVVDVTQCSALNENHERAEGFDGGWWITYRVIKHWGKEAWNRGHRSPDD